MNARRPLKGFAPLGVALLLAGCWEDAVDATYSGPPVRGELIEPEIPDANETNELLDLPVPPITEPGEPEQVVALPPQAPVAEDENVTAGENVNGDENVTVVEGEITSPGTPDDPFTEPDGREVTDLPLPPGAAESNATAIDPVVVSNLPPLEEGSAYSPVSFKTFSNFEYEVEWETHGGEKFDPVSFAKRVPGKVREMDGKSVAVEGFMLPTVVNEDNKVTEFLLLPDQMSCCFGKAPEANGWIVVTADEGAELLMDRIIRVTGTIAVEERWDEEFFVGLYHVTLDDLTGPAL